MQTIAEQGYTQTSFAEIAKGLGITKGLIAYHFNGKHDLITSAIHTILNRQGAYIKEQVDAQEDASDKLRAYIESSFELYRAEPSTFCGAGGFVGQFHFTRRKAGVQRNSL